MNVTSHIVAFTGLVLGTTAYADLPPVPSGQSLEVFEETFHTTTPTRRQFYLGILAPAITEGGEVGFEAANADIDVLCEDYALNKAQNPNDGLDAAHEVVIRLMDKPIKYGDSNPDIRQYMGFYDISEGLCEWH
ncbi:hypothetical protein F9L33_01220 [Amylibacter sp. SFDW26]|uniref:DUF6497 family protein n=1 Tax=Amylibacter sp. SFDW26 TaxID=2652722 RepID=UPI00126246AC|nr:DUF6497 family protein [Amylibacter sp. SFDW26]KAB7615416.1 hypothetical protein F9L33_01220 [Amylibacter sp. SFDW26]